MQVHMEGLFLMEIRVKVKPNSKKEKIEQRNNIYIVYVKEKAEKGMANLAVIKLLNKKFGKSFRILKGKKSREKILKSL